MSMKQLDEIFEGVPEAERDKIMSEGRELAGAISAKFLERDREDQGACLVALSIVLAQLLTSNLAQSDEVCEAFDDLVDRECNMILVAAYGVDETTH